MTANKDQAGDALLFIYQELISIPFSTPEDVERFDVKAKEMILVSNLFEELDSAEDERTN